MKRADDMPARDCVYHKCKGYLVAGAGDVAKGLKPFSRIRVVYRSGLCVLCRHYVTFFIMQYV